MPDDDLVDIVGSRAGWTIDSTDPPGATYAPGGEWTAVVRQLWNPQGRHTGYVWHIARQQRGIARYTQNEYTAARAVAVAESLPET